MKNINKKSILNSFKVLSVIAFGLLFVPAQVYAGTNYIWGAPDNITFGNGYVAPNNTFNTSPNQYQQSSYAPGYSYGSNQYPTYAYAPAPTPTTVNTPTIYSSEPTNNATAKSSTPKTVAKKSTPTTVASANVPTGNLSGYMLVPIPAGTTAGVQTASTTGATDGYGNLAASVILGTSSFMPTGILQWLLLAILILAMIILVRRIFGGTKKYMMVPLKHS